MKLLFELVSCFLGLESLFFAVLFIKTRSESAEKLRTIFRRPLWLGMILGTFVLVWAGYEGALMLEGPLERLRIAVWIIVPTTIVLSYFCLDFVNARAFGGAFVLCSNYVMNGAFAHDVPARCVVSVICIALSVFGMFGIGLPWHYRNLIEYCTRRKAVGTAAGVVFGLVGVALLVFPWFARM